MISYGKNLKKEYRIEINTNYLDTPFTFKIYQSKRKPIFRDIVILNNIFKALRILSFIFLPIAILFNLILNYYDGAKNFYRNGIWVNNVRFFNWTNIVFILFLIICFIFK